MRFSEWDHRNRLTSATDYEGYGDPGTDDDFVLKQVDYTYDPFNQLIKRTLDPDGPGSDLIEQTFFLYEMGQVVLQFDKTGSGDVAAGDLSHRYLWGPAVDQLLADEQVTSLSSPGQTYWPLTDHLGSVRDVVDSAGKLRIHRQFDGFGNIAES